MHGVLYHAVRLKIIHGLFVNYTGATLYHMQLVSPVKSYCVIQIH